MANKTIGQLDSLTPSSTTKLAVYDDTTQTTGKATVSDLLDTENLVYADDAMSPGSTAELDFASEDTSLTPSSTTSVDLLQGSDGWSQRFVKVSQMFKNIRWILSKLGSTALGTTATTITGAIAEHEQDISTLNSNSLISIPFRIALSNIAADAASAIGTDITLPSGYTAVGACCWQPDIFNRLIVWVGNVENSRVSIMYINLRTSAVSCTVRGLVFARKS